MKPYPGDPEPLVNDEILLGVAEAGQELGIDLRPLLEKHQIDRKVLVSPEGFLRHRQVAEFLEAVAAECDCQHFGFLVGKHQPPLRFGLVTQALKVSRNLREALENGVRYQPLFSEVPRHELVLEGDGYARFVRWERVPITYNAGQMRTLGVVQLFRIFKILAGNSWRAGAVHFASSAPSEHRQYARFFDCPVLFDSAFDGIVFSERDLYTPIETADPVLLKLVKISLDQVLKERSELVHSSTDVATMMFVQRQLGSGRCNLESCADFLGLHPRTLQRALADKGTSFKQLLLETRMNIAKKYLLSSRIPLSELSDLLGYRNLSAFTRAFSSSIGVSPREWRASRAGAC